MTMELDCIIIPLHKLNLSKMVNTKKQTLKKKENGVENFILVLEVRTIYTELT